MKSAEKAFAGESLWIENGKRRLYARLLTSKGTPGRLPAVICSHGFGSSYRLCLSAVGERLAAAGFAVCCFDFYGGSVFSRSGGKMTEMSVFTEQSDLHAVIDRVKRLPLIDPDRIFLFGESQGGFVSAITAADRPADIRGLILWYPAFCIPDDAKRRHPTRQEIPDSYRIMGRKVGRIYSEGLYDYDVYEQIAKYEGPVLIVHGDSDRVVDLSYSKKAAACYSSSELTILPHEGHGFSRRGKAQAAARSEQFITDILTGGRNENNKLS